MDEIVKKWDDLGFLFEVDSKELKEKLATAYELAGVLILSDNIKIKNNLDVIIFPIIRRMISGTGDSKTLPNDFVFTEETMIQLINLVNECCETEKYEKYINRRVIDVESELVSFIADLFSTEKRKLSKMVR